jgi:DNA-binding GntR family transcriptional regulator
MGRLRLYQPKQAESDERPADPPDDVVTEGTVGLGSKDEDFTVQRKNLTDQLYEILEARIISGSITPGTRLSEESVAEAFGVSRSPAREAITELERIGLAARVGPRDRIVATPSVKLISDTFEAWWILDSGRTYLSSLRATPSDHRRLYALLDALDLAVGPERLPERKRLSQEFHDLLTGGCDNARLDAILSDFEKYIRWFKMLYFEELDGSTTSRDEHRAIVDNYVRQDLQSLTDLIRRHILGQRDQIIARIRQLQ